MFLDSIFLDCYSDDKVDVDGYILLLDSFSFLILLFSWSNRCGDEQLICLFLVCLPLESAF